MANVYAVKSGNWSDPTVWNTGALPTAADDVYSNNFTVAADTTTTVLSIRNGSTTGVTAGGGFTAVNGVTLTLTGEGVVAGTLGSLNCFASTLTTGQVCTIIGNATGGPGGNASPIAVNNLSSGTLNIVGNCIALSANTSIGARNSSTGTMNITGNCTGGSNNFGISPGALNASTGTMSITGDCTGGAGSNCPGAYNISTGTMNITGNCTGGFGGTGAGGARNDSTGNLSIIGALFASSGSPGISLGSFSQNTFLTGPFIGTAQGVAANVALRWRWVPSVGSSYMTVPNSTATGYKNLYTADSTDSQSGQPATTNVRSGTVYGPNSELTGTCAVPAASSVAFGVPIDNTTGTAYLTSNDIATALSAASAVTLSQPVNSIATPGSIGERLKNTATIASVSQQFSDVFSTRQ